MRIPFCFIFSSLIFAQVNKSFPLELNRIQSLDSFDNKKLYIKNSSLASTLFLPMYSGRNKNIVLSNFMILGETDSKIELTPVIAGSIKVSWNLSIAGRMSAFSNQNNAINIYGWGLAYKPGKEDKLSPWNFGLSSGVYQSFNKIRTSSFSLSIIRTISLSKLDVFMGISSSNVKGIDYSIDQKSDSQNIQKIFNSFLIGTTFEFRGIKVLPAVNYSVDSFVMAIGLQKEF